MGTSANGRKQSYHIRCTFGFGGLQLVNSVVAKSRSQEMRRPEWARRGVYWLCKDNRGSGCVVCVCMRYCIIDTLHGLQGGRNGKRYQMHGQVGHNGRWAAFAGFYSRVGPDTIDFRFRFSAESPALLSVAHTVSAECDRSLSGFSPVSPKPHSPKR